MSQRYILVLDLQLQATESDDGKRKVQSHETSLSKQMHTSRTCTDTCHSSHSGTLCVDLFVSFTHSDALKPK